MQSKIVQIKAISTFSVGVFLLAVFLIVLQANAADTDTPNPITPDENVVFVDSLTKPLEKPWEWVRESPDAKRITEKGLEIKLEPGGLMGGGRDAKNLLVRPWPKESSAVSVFVDARHERQFEQAGFLVYKDDDNYIKIVKEMVDGVCWIVYVVEIEAAPKIVGKVRAPKKGVWLGLAIEEEKIKACFSADGKHYKSAGEAEFPMDPKPRIGIFTQSGHPGVDYWVRFADFRLLKSKVWDVENSGNDG